jgi:hypothetical protein
MSALLRRLRGLVGLGLFSGVLWTAIGFMITGAIYLIDPADFGPGESPLLMAWYIGRAGVVAGVVAGLTLAVVERRRTLGGLTIARVGAWGALGGFVLPFIAVAPQPMLPIFVVMGAATGVSALALARRGERVALANPSQPLLP